MHDINQYSGWVVLAGKTRVQDPHANFRHAFAGSSTSSNDVCTGLISVSSSDPMFNLPVCSCDVQGPVLI